MDIGRINTGLDKFMRRIYGVDVYLTENQYGFGDKEYLINILFFPSKFLQASPEYSEKYHKFFDRTQYEIEGDIFRALKLLGINSKDIQGDSLRIKISSDLPEYLQTYSKELVDNINKFIDTQTILDGVSLSDRVSNVRVGTMIPSVPYRSEGYDPHILLRLDYDETSGVNIDSNFMNDSYVRNPMIDYLKTKMDLDPQIDFWFD